MSAVGRIVVAGTGALTTILVARLLGPDGAGGYALAQTLILLLILLTTLGVEHGMTYYVSNGRWGPLSAYRSAQLVALAAGVVGLALGVGARLAVPAAFGELSVADTAVAAFALPFALSWFYFSYVALAIDRYEAYAVPPPLQSTLALVFVAGLAVAAGLEGAIAGFTAAHVVTAIVFLVLGRRTIARAGRPEPTPPPHQLRHAIRFGVKGYAANALQFLNNRIDLFVLAAAASADEVGQYSVAVAVTSVMWLLPQALNDVLFPRIAALTAAGQDARATLTIVETKTLRHSVLVCVVGSAALAIALLALVVPVYGADFRPAIELGLIMLPGVALLGVSGTLLATFVGRGHPGYSLAITAIVTPVTLLLYALLIPAEHARGAALASSISYAVTFVLAALVYRRATGAAVLPRLLPTRSELADYRALLSTLQARAGRV